jgi:hypothetical protein
MNQTKFVQDLLHARFAHSFLPFARWLTFPVIIFELF